MGHLLEVDNLCVTYRSVKTDTPVLKNVTFAVKEGETVTIVGESGSGKSTIGKALSGLLTPSTLVQGKMKLNNETYDLSDRKLNWAKIRGKAIGHIFQDPHSSLNPRRKIKKQFSDILIKSQRLSKTECFARAEKLLTLLNFKDPTAVLESYPFQLSGGMCQRVSIALNLALRPQIIIADEITSALDLKSQNELVELLEQIKKEFHTGILFITHDLNLAARISDQILYLANGKFESPESYPCLRTLSCCEHMPDCEQCDKTILKVDHLNKSYYANTILRNVTFSQKEGEVLGILGESGCGKSTLARLISGIEDSYTGDIYLGQENLKARIARDGRNIYRDLQIVFQDERGCLNPYKKIIDIVEEPIKNLRKNNVNARGQGEKYLRLVGLDESLFFRKAPNLSTGQCQRVSIARALALEPKLLILDEVVSALDCDIKWQIVDLLKTIKEKTGVSMLMISHEIEVLQSLCHRIALIKDGSIKEIIETDEQSLEKMREFLLEDVHAK